MNAADNTAAASGFLRILVIFGVQRRVLARQQRKQLA